MVRNWFHLGQQFKLSNETLKEIEYGPFSPTEVLMKYMYSRKTDLTIGKFYDEVKKLKRHDVLKKLDPFIVGESKTWTFYTMIIPWTERVANNLERKFSAVKTDFELRLRKDLVF